MESTMTKEKTITSSNGLGYLFLILFLLLFAVAVIIFRANNPSDDYMDAVYIVLLNCLLFL
jgi:hypothetical protein